jgi:hypothetical protein
MQTPDALRPMGKSRLVDRKNGQPTYVMWIFWGVRESGATILRLPPLAGNIFFIVFTSRESRRKS